MTKPHSIEWSDEQVSRLWDYYSKTPPYSDIYFSKVFGGRILQGSGVPMDQELEVLDFGCGPGHIWEHILKAGAKWQYSGVDFSADSITRINEQAGSHPQFAGAQHISTTPISLPPAIFDVVLLIEVVEHLTDDHLGQTLDEACRLLKPGGVAVISTPNDEDLSRETRFCPECGAVFHQWQHVRSWTVSSLASRLREHNFNLVRHKTLDFGASGLLGKLNWILQGIYKRKFYRPHMIATFQKQ